MSFLNDWYNYLRFLGFLNFNLCFYNILFDFNWLLMFLLNLLWFLLLNFLLIILSFNFYRLLLDYNFLWFFENFNFSWFLFNHDWFILNLLDLNLLSYLLQFHCQMVINNPMGYLDLLNFI